MMSNISRRNTTSLKNALELSKIYFVPSMVKFPLVISKNGIFNGIFGILLFGGVFTVISNLILKKIIQKSTDKPIDKSDSLQMNKSYEQSMSKSNEQLTSNIQLMSKSDDQSVSKSNEQKEVKLQFGSYEEISQKIMKNHHRFVKWSIFIFRLLVIFYCIDLMKRFLSCINLTHFLILPLLLIFSILLNTNENISRIGNWRNVINFLILSLTTSSLCRKLDVKSVDLSKGYFDSVGLTMICFSQQTITPAILKNIDGFGVILSGILTVTAYISIGICGFLYERTPDVNWMENVPGNLRFVPTLILIITSMMAYPIILKNLTCELLFIIQSNRNTYELNGKRSNRNTYELNGKRSNRNTGELNDERSNSNSNNKSTNQSNINESNIDQSTNRLNDNQSNSTKLIENQSNSTKLNDNQSNSTKLIENQSTNKWNKIKEFLVNGIFSLILIPLTALFIKSELGSSLAMIFSSLTMIVFPTEFYFRTFSRKSPLILLQIMGISIILRGIFEIVNKKLH